MLYLKCLYVYICVKLLYYDNLKLNVCSIAKCVSINIRKLNRRVIEILKLHTFEKE